MAKLSVGAKMPDFTAETVFGGRRKMSELAGPSKTAVVFLRYYGCTLCQYDIHSFAQHYSEISAGGGRLYIVLQSTPESIKKHLKAGELPFEIICDPQAELYQEFEIRAAADMAELGGGATAAKIAEAKQAFRHGDYEGNELQLPAAFVVGSDLTLTYVHYGQNAGDVPTPAELTDLLR